jgi:hypothetical protein
MTGRTAFRGQPLLVLGALIAAWMGMRVAVWQPPFEDAPPMLRVVAAAPRLEAAPALPSARATEVAPNSSPGPAPFPPMWSPPAEAEVLPPPVSSAPPSVPEPLAARVQVDEVETVAPPLAAPRVVVGHNLLLVAGLAQMEVPPMLLAYLQSGAQPRPGVPPTVPVLVEAAAPPHLASASRWSGDGWLLLRRDTTTPFLSGRPSYGRSQAGAVIRYNLASASALRPQAHVRVSSALAGAREQELAVGFSARPHSGVPIRLVAEGRVSETVRGTEIRPAAYAVTEFPPLKLPLGLRGETYAQAGYVGGTFATVFADGQARVERPLAHAGAAEVSAGGGMWGGTQRGSARLDIGPTAAVSFRLGEARGRIAADYRFRVAGDAEPSSGPALTLSAGF